MRSITEAATSAVDAAAAGPTNVGYCIRSLGGIPVASTLSVAGCFGLTCHPCSTGYAHSTAVNQLSSKASFTPHPN